MIDDRDIRRIWRKIARGLGILEPGDRRDHLEQLRAKLFPFLPAFDDREQPKTLAVILEEENAGIDPVDCRIEAREISAGEILDAWDSLFRFTIAVNEKAPGLGARSLWDTVADLSIIPEDRRALEGWLTISEAFEREVIETLPQRHQSETGIPPPLANPPELLAADTALIETSPDYQAPLPVDARAFHRILKLKDVAIIGAELPASLGGGIPVSLSGKFIPDVKERGGGYAGGDLPAGLAPYLFLRGEISERGRERVGQAFLLPAAGIPDNHFHGLIDSLPSLRHYLDEGLTCPIVIPPLGRGIRPLLAMFLQQHGIPEDRIWSQERASACLFTEAIMPPRYGHARDLPEFYRPLVKRALEETDGRRFPPRIYLKRGSNGPRALANEPDIEKTMERFGFQVIEIWKPPIGDQIGYLAHAEIVAGPFGAGLTNLVFAKEGTRVIEILNHKHFTELGMPYKRISDSCGLEHYSVVPDSLFNSRSLTPERITISIRRLEKILKCLAPPKGLQSRFHVWKHDLARARRR